MAPGRGTTPGLHALNAACFTIPLLAPDALGAAIPSNDPYEANFTTGQRNIFRQAWQRRMDVSLVKNTSLSERMNLKFSFDVFNITNTPSVDVPIDNVTQNQYYNGFPTVGTPASPTACGGSNTGCCNCP